MIDTLWWYLRSHLWIAAMLLTLGVLLGDVALAGAQSPRYQIAVLTPGQAFDVALDGLREGLTQRGYIEGQNIFLNIEDTHGDIDHLAEHTTKMMLTKPNLIVTLGTAQTSAAKQAAATLPIVFAFVADPLRAGLVASHVSSQNNLTGIANHAGTFSGVRLEILQEILPGAKRILVPVAVHEAVAEISWRDLATLAPKLGIELLRRDVTNKAQLAQVLKDMPPGSVDAIFQLPSSLVGSQVALLIRQGLESKVPVIVSESSMVERGALLSYGADFRLLGMQAAKLIAKILQGTKPSDIPIQTPESLVLAVNVKTARLIGLELPTSVLERADRVVE